VIAALIVAGESSSRTGRPLALLPFPDVPLVAAQWLALRAAGLDPLRIAVREDAAEITAGSGLARENFVRVRSRAHTPFASLQRGLTELLEADDWPAVVVQPLEALPPHPSVVVALVERLLAGGLLAVLPAHRGKRGHPVVLAREVAIELLRLDPRRSRLDVSLQRLEAMGAAERVEVYTGDVLRNLDDPATWRRALREARERDRGARVWSRLPA
jgi:CTP:molybdopterin cytidylyltransferase MocA